jgi:hypothetical protein
LVPGLFIKITIRIIIAIVNVIYLVQILIAIANIDKTSLGSFNSVNRISIIDIHIIIFNNFDFTGIMIIPIIIFIDITN